MMAAITAVTFPAQILVEEPALHYLSELKPRTELMTASNGDLNLAPAAPGDV
mgnify:CR=1 FL=1